MRVKEEIDTACRFLWRPTVVSSSIKKAGRGLSPLSSAFSIDKSSVSLQDGAVNCCCRQSSVPQNYRHQPNSTIIRHDIFRNSSALGAASGNIKICTRPQYSRTQGRSSWPRRTYHVLLLLSSRQF